AVWWGRGVAGFRSWSSLSEGAWAARFLCLLAPQLWAGEGPRSARSGHGVLPLDWVALRRVHREEFVSRQARSAAEAVALHAADRRPQSKGQKAIKNHLARQGRVLSSAVGASAPRTPTRSARRRGD